MQRVLIGIFCGAAAAVATALAWTTVNPPLIGSNDLAAQRQTERYVADELKALREEVAKLREEAIEERVIELPEDGGRYHLTLVLQDGWQGAPTSSARVFGWFGSDPRLVALKEQCHFHVYTPKHAWYRRNSHLAQAVPSVVLQRHDGYVVFKRSGRNVPGSPAELADAIADCCPRPRPTPPAPAPQPQPTPFPPVIPDTIPPPDLKPEEPVEPVADEPGLLYLIPLLLGGAGGGVITARKPKPL